MLFKDNNILNDDHLLFVFQTKTELFSSFEFVSIGALFLKKLLSFSFEVSK